MSGSKIVSAFAAAVVGLGLASTSEATLLAYEGYDYNTGSYNGAIGGSGWTNAWTTPASHSVATPGRTYTDSNNNQLDVEGNYLRISNNSGTTTTGAGFRNFTAFTLSAATPELWISYLGEADAGASGSHVAYTIFNSSTEIALLGKSGAQQNWGINPTGSADDVQGTVDATDPAFLVFKFTWTGAATPATVELWVDPDLDSTPLSVDADVDTQTANFTVNRVRASTSGNSANLDEFRIGTTFADVAPIVPEPATAGLAALGTVAMLARRRRQA